MVIGDRLYCKKGCIPLGITRGKIYEICSIKQQYLDSNRRYQLVFAIYDDKDSKSYFVGGGGGLGIVDWFYTEKELRKQKLIKINNT